MRPTTHEISVETTSFKDTQLDLRRNEEFQLPEEGYKMLRKGMSVSFVMRGFSNTDIFRAGSFGTSSKKEKLISEYEKIYTLDRKGKVLRRRTERKVTNIDLIIQAEMSVSLQISERRKIIVITPTLLGEKGESPKEYEVEIIDIENEKDTETVKEATKGKTRELIEA